nr:MFS transporter [uncultured Brevundimonas sp.]
MSSATPELIHTHRPRLSGLAIWNMCVGFFGIQIGFGLQNANTSRIFQTLGAEVDSLAILWIAAPLTGLLVQPIIGHFSDRTWTRFGRRRPYFLVGAILTTLALIAMPNSPSLWFAAAMLWIMDASINITMEPFRAFVGDNLPEEQRTAGYAMQSFFIGAGAVFASVLPWLLSNVFDVASTALEGVVPLSVRIAFYVGAAGLFGAVLWTVLSTREYSPEQIAAFERARGLEPAAPGEEPPAKSVREWLVTGLVCAVLGALALVLIGLLDLEKELLILGGFALGFGLLLIVVGMMQRRRITNAATEIVNDVFRMPATMRGLAVVQFFSWFALFAMWIYTTAAVTSVHYGATDTTSAAYNQGADWVGVLMGVYNGVAALAAFALPVLARRIGRKATHALMLLFGAAGLAGIFLIREPGLLWLPMVGVGFAWASIVSMPYAILSGAVPDRKMGVYMGVFNIFIVVPQLLAATVLGLILRTMFDGQAIYALLLGAASFVLAAISALRVKEHRA